ncbi:UNVERIFIED_CONTAM: hypothetical protein Sradi_4664900 [Sesamum radiatum]|uniref:Late embryogenesis abundant protein LEA-2 subgroup domain-containing protein n=1 Tax=Sesamum radiatum TaxID=300843 RepID=A0AAW2MS74_SESRA
MGVAMHVKSDSEVTSIEASTPPRSPRRPLYYVQSPSHSQHDLEKMSYGWSPFGSPTHHFQYHCSPIHHSRESSTSRFSASLKNPRNSGGGVGGWRRMQRKYDEVGDEAEEDEEGEGKMKQRWGANEILCGLLSVVVRAAFFYIFLDSLGCKFSLQTEDNREGVPTDMLTLNSTVKIFYRNPSTFFGVHVTSTPLEFHYFDLKVASGHMRKLCQSRRSDSKVIAVVEGHQVPLYGGIPVLNSAKGHPESMSVPLNLTFVVRSRAYILGRLVKPKFYLSILCGVTMRGNHLGKPLNLTKSQSCVYH